MVILGKKYKDVVTGFTGIATALTKYLTGCDRAMFTPEAKEGEIKDSNTFDVFTLEEIGEWCFSFFQSETKKDTNERKTGGPEMYKSNRAY